MAKLLKLRRGTTSQHSSFTGAEGEVTIDTDKDVPVVHDGSTAGGHPVAAEDLANVSSSTIVGRLVQQSIPTSHIANGALPSGVTVADANISGNLTIATADIVDSAVTSAKIADGAIVNADINASAAIAGTKISPAFTSNISITNSSPYLDLDDSDNNSDYRIENANGSLKINDKTNSGATRLQLHGDGTFDVNGNLDANSGLDVTGNITVSGTVDGVDVAALNSSVSGLGISGGAIASATTATTQSASDNSTKVATTAYVTTAVSNLVDSAPGALNTLNELAAAMGDDANFSTTVTNSIATKMPLAGGAFTGNVTTSGNITWGDSNSAIFGAGNDLNIYHNGTDSVIDNNTNNLELVTQNSMLFKIADAESAIICNKHGSVDLYYDNAKKLETTSTGITVSSNVNCGNVYCSNQIGLDSTDNITFTNNTRMDVTINGNNEFRFEADGDFHADGDVVAFSTTTASDEKLKENIEVVSNALDKIEALRGVTFDWKRDGKSSAGVIAQEVMGVLPEAVKEVQGLNDNESHLSVNYHALTSILIESIKELSARVKELEAK